MKKNILIVFAVITTLFAYGCSNDEIDNQTAPDYNQAQEAPFTLNAKVTVSEPFQTKASLVETVEGTTKTLRFEWIDGDKIQLAFVQEGKDPEIREATVTDVATDKRTGNFSVELPEEIDGNFTLYAYYGAGSIDEENSTNIILPDAGALTGTLSEQVKVLSMWDKKNILFDGVTPPELSINFKHIGAIMTLHVKNTSSDLLNDIANIELDGSSNWLYNEDSRAVFDMSSGTFTATKGEGSTLSISIGETIGAGETKTFYRWFVPGDFEQGLQLGLQSGVRASNINILPSNLFETGVNYGLDITIDESNLDFVGVLPKIVLTTSKQVGETIQMRMGAYGSYQDDVWIDLNNNGIKETGEDPVEFSTTYRNYIIGSQTITIYGRLNRFEAASSNLTHIDVSSSPFLETFNVNTNELTEIDLTRNTSLRSINVYGNQLTELDVTKNTLVHTLYVQSNQLTGLDVSNNPDLKILNLQSNQLATTESVNSIYNQLPDRSGIDQGEINVRYGGNSGHTTADHDIALNKNWKVITNSGTLTP